MKGTYVNEKQQQSDSFLANIYTTEVRDEFTPRCGIQGVIHLVRTKTNIS